MKTATIVAVILGLLVIISVVQAFQLNSLKEKVAEGKLVVSSSAAKTEASSGQTAKKTAALPSSIQNLPQMVGGC